MGSAPTCLPIFLVHYFLGYSCYLHQTYGCGISPRSRVWLLNMSRLGEPTLHCRAPAGCLSCHSGLLDAVYQGDFRTAKRCQVHACSQTHPDSMHHWPPSSPMSILEGVISGILRLGLDLPREGYCTTPLSASREGHGAACVT